MGDMLHALHQNPYRPAHLHCMIQAEGYDRLINFMCLWKAIRIWIQTLCLRAQFLYWRLRAS